MKTIYFDMDGVLFDFNSEKKALKRFATEKGFFANLKPIKRNYALVNQLKANGYNVKILSASPNAQADKDKMESIKSYLPTLDLDNDIILCRLGEDKAKYVEDIENSILIDDYSMNLKKWFNQGGLAIKYVGKGDNTYGTHTRLGIPYVTDIREIVEYL